MTMRYLRRVKGVIRRYLNKARTISSSVTRKNKKLEVTIGLIKNEK